LDGSGKRIEAEDVRESFVRLLIGDVIEALERAEFEDSQAARRNLVRILFAAIEGLVWELREHVRSIAEAVDELPVLTSLALTDTSYGVSSSGEVVPQLRFLPLKTSVQVATALAKKLCPTLNCDFGTSGWVDFSQAIMIRNRVTHPKTVEDLTINQHDIAVAKAGFAWLIQHVETVMRATLNASKRHLDELTEFADALVGGDPVALAQYRAALIKRDE
jgi:hypothetical protein